SYSVRIRSTNYVVTKQDQSPPVTVRADTPPPASITNVTATDGVAGFDDMVITWSSTGAITAGATVKIEILRGGAVVPAAEYTINSVPLNSYSYRWPNNRGPI